MKSLTLNTHDLTGGAARAAFRLHKGLQSAGVDATMMVREQSGSDPSVIALGNKFAGRVRALCDSLPLRSYPKRQLHNFSPAIMPDKVVAKVAQMHPDIVHLHWVAEGFLQVESLARFNCPIVWTLHDSWPFTGGCHLPRGCTRYRQYCGSCPVLGSAKDDDLSRKIWQRKKRAWSDLPLTFVAPSRWLAECARSSSLLSQSRVENIPNGINVETYSPGDSTEARRALGLSTTKFLILFGGMHGLTDSNKGFDLLSAALGCLDEKLRDASELVVFGDQEDLVLPDCGMPVKNLGIVRDENSIVSLYRAADVFVAPSRQENLPNMVMEAMACGTPCVVFAVGGMPDIVTHSECGYLAKPYDLEDLNRGIVWALTEGEQKRWRSLRAREKIVREFSLEQVARRYYELYSELIPIRE